MKREIKFRAWDKSRVAYRTQQNLLDDICRFHREDGSYFDVNLWRFLTLVPQQDNFVLEQYTGIKDKNGKEIYESDILRRFDILYMVRYGIGKMDGDYYQYPGFYLENSKTKEIAEPYPITDLVKDSTQFEVVGNVHENMELLK